MKKLICGLLAFAMLFFMCSCSSAKQTSRELSIFIADLNFEEVENVFNTLSDAKRREMETQICDGLKGFIISSMPSISMLNSIEAACNMLEYYEVDENSEYYDTFQLYLGWKNYYQLESEWNEFGALYDEFGTDIATAISEVGGYFSDTSLSGLQDVSSSFSLLYSELGSQFGNSDGKCKEYLSIIKEIIIKLESVCTAIKNHSGTNFQNAKEGLVNALEDERSFKLAYINSLQEKIDFMQSDLFLKYYGDMMEN